MVGAAPVGEDDWGTAFNQCRAFLEFVVARAEQTLPLQEVITVLGWAQWREIDTRHTIGHIERVVARLQESGEMTSYPADLVVNMIYGLMVDAAMNLTSQPDPEQAYEDVEGVVRHMLMGLKNTDR